MRRHQGISRAQEAALEQLEGLYKRKGHHNQRFVTQEDLEAFWTPRLEKFSRDAGLNLATAEMKEVQEHRLRILSTLISIGWEDLYMFRKLFVLNPCRDAALPLNAHSPQLQSLTPSRREQFETAQYIYIPVTLGPSGVMKVYSERQRMPFVASPELIGDGSYGDVFKEVVAARHLILIDRSSNGLSLDSKDEYSVARKELKETQATIEIQNLQHVQSSMVSHDRIVQHLAMYKVGGMCHILFPLAKANLANFLIEKEYEQLFEAPAYIRSFLSEASHLAGALEYLHTCMGKPGEIGSVCCHMDLKTDNILVFLSNDTFQWKITDFGISRIKPDPRRPATLGEVVKQMTTKTFARRSSGEFQAPEMHFKQHVGRKSDIWSLGCIVLKVIIRGVMGTSALKTFDENKRANEWDDDYFQDGRDLKRPVREWLQMLPDENGPYIDKLTSGLGVGRNTALSILSEFRRIISEALSHSPVDRPRAAAIKNRLRAICELLSNGHVGSYLADEQMNLGSKALQDDEWSKVPELMSPDMIEALARLQKRTNWFQPALFRRATYNFAVSPKVSRDLCRWLGPDCTQPIFALLERLNGTPTISKISSCLCASIEGSGWLLVPCFTLRAPGKPSTPPTKETFLDLLLTMISGLLPVLEKPAAMVKGFLELELLCKRDTLLAHGLASRLISDLLGHLKGKCLILIDEFSEFDHTPTGQLIEHWIQLSSILTRSNSSTLRTVKLFIRTSRTFNMQQVDGALGSVFMPNAQVVDPVPLVSKLKKIFIPAE